MRIAFVYLPGRRERLPQLSAGKVPSEFFYGAVELAAAGHAVEHFEFPAHSPARLTAAALDLVRRAYLTPPKTFGHTLVNAWNLSPTLNDFDCIVATVGHHAFAFAMCAVAGRLRRPIVGIQCGLLHHRYPAPRRVLTRALLNHMDSVLFGVGEEAPLRAEFAPDPDRFTVEQFGVDTRFWFPAGQRENFVLAVGNDQRRDYATLLGAAAEIGATIQLVTRLPLPPELPANVTVHRGSWQDRALSDEDLRNLYRRAACVVTPLHDTLQPSGQSVTLQAMACGAPVVLTHTRGLWNPAVLRDGENLRLVKVGDSGDLSAAVRGILADPIAADRLAEAGRRSVLEHGDIRAFAAGIGRACERAVAR